MQTGLLLTSVVLVCYFDGRYRRIPNQITFSLLLLGMVINVWQRGLLGLGGSLLGTFVGLAVLIIPYCGGGIGAGDVKFSAAIGSLMGPGFAFAAFLYGAILGGVWACAVLLKRRNLLQSLTAMGYRAAILVSGSRILAPPLHSFNSGREWGLPYGIAIGLGAAAALVFGNPF